MENRLKMLLIKAFGGYLQAEQWDRRNRLIWAGGEGGIQLSTFCTVLRNQMFSGYFHKLERVRAEGFVTLECSRIASDRQKGVLYTAFECT